MKYLFVGILTILLLVWLEFSGVHIPNPFVREKVTPAVEERGDQGVDSLVKNTAAQEPKKVYTPGPLRSRLTGLTTVLTTEGVLQFTNTERRKAGLTPLRESSMLRAAASQKVGDMFSQNYFAHVSPDGRGPADFVETAGYSYIVVGENLALGDFRNDEDLVKSWMDSPGHRANILGSRFREIGIALKQGRFEGRNTWLAVELFATPLSVCPTTNEVLKGRIDERESTLTSLERRLDNLQSQIAAAETEGKEDEHRQLVSEYNTLVEQHNSLVRESKLLVNEYNESVRIYNECVKQFAGSR